MSKTSNCLNFILFFILLLWCYVFCANYWISDDAFITVRTIDNFFNGHGLRFNVAERVQAYTHPLWLIHLGFFMIIFPNPVWAIFGLSFVCSALAIGLLFRFIPDRKVLALVLIISLSSQAFAHYTSSGLENSLAFVLLGLLYGFFISRHPGIWSYRSSGLYLLLAVLACCLRLDFVLLLFIPGMFVSRELWLKRPSIPAFVTTSFSILAPILLWHIFSFLYYGWPLPNTYYAKIGYLVERNTRLEWGLYYLLRTLDDDPITIPVIMLGLLSGAFLKEIRSSACAASIFFYCLYIVWIGGDHMLGRFFSVPFYLSLFLIAPYLRNTVQSRIRSGIAVFLLGVYHLVFPLSPLKTGAINFPEPQHDRVENEQAVYYSDSNPWYGRERKLIINEKQLSGLQASCIASQQIGRLGYLGGPELHVLDHAGLADPLLARISPDPVAYFYNGFRAGHLIRRIPDGYMRSCIEGQNLIEDPKLRSYYDKIILVTRGDIFNSERLQLIAPFSEEMTAAPDPSYDGITLISGEPIAVKDNTPDLSVFQRRETP